MLAFPRQWCLLQDLMTTYLSSWLSSIVPFMLPYTHPKYAACSSWLQAFGGASLSPEHPFSLSTSHWICNNSNAGSLVKLSSKIPPQWWCRMRWAFKPLQSRVRWALWLSSSPSKPGTAWNLAHTQQFLLFPANTVVQQTRTLTWPRVLLFWKVDHLSNRSGSWRRAAFPTHLNSTDTQGARLLRIFWKKTRKWPGVSGIPVSRVVALRIELFLQGCCRAYWPECIYQVPSPLALGFWLKFKTSLFSYNHSPQNLAEFIYYCCKKICYPISFLYFYFIYSSQRRTFSTCQKTEICLWRLRKEY